MSSTDYAEYRQQLARNIKRLRTILPEATAGFENLRRAALAPGSLDTRVKELIALGIGVHSGCRGCIAFHVHDALGAGATRAEVEEVIGIAVLMGGGPGLMNGAEALDALDQFEKGRRADSSSDAS